MRENTIASLKYAHAHGADMVEFDVQLSKDKIPVIYHDFELCTSKFSCLFTFLFTFLIRWKPSANSTFFFLHFDDNFFL